MQRPLGPAVFATSSLRITIVSLLFICFGFSSSAVTDGSVEQVHFSAEDTGVKKPVRIPAEVMAILGGDPVVKAALESEGVSLDKLPSSWFSASIAHLSNTKRGDLIVVGEPPIAGGNTVTFWIFIAKSFGYELALTIHSHDLIITKTRWRDYREVEVPSATLSGAFRVYYRYNGLQYEAFRQMRTKVE